MTVHQLLSCSLLVGMLTGYWFLMARGELAEIDAVQAEIRDLHSTLADSELQAARLEDVRAEVDEVSRWLERVQSFYATEGEAPDFLLDVAAALRECDLRPRETSPEPPRDLDPLLQQGIHVVVQGPLENVFAFLHRMEESRPLCRVTELRLQATPSSGEVRADLTVLRLWREA